MPLYYWEGKTKTGGVRTGVLNAPNEAVVRANLERLQIKVTRVSTKPKKKLSEITLFERGVGYKELAVFTRQFATMIDAGLPLVQCLGILAEQQQNKSFKRIINQIRTDVEGGSTLASAFAKHPKVFSPLFVNLVNAGEVGGTLDTIMLRLADYIEKIMKLKKKVKGAMVYPAVVLFVSLIVLAVILLFVIPVFKKLFESYGQALPYLTQLVLNISEFTQKYILYILAAIFLFAIILRLFYKKTYRGKLILDHIMLRFPIIGDLLRKSAIARFSRTLSTMITSGVPILDALEIVSKTVGNLVIERAVLKGRENIAEGRTIAEPLAETKVFPVMVTQMIAAGEAAGELDMMLEKIADFYDEEVDSAVEALTSIIEPVMIVFLGGMIGFLVVSMYLPIFQIAGVVGG